MNVKSEKYFLTALHEASFGGHAGVVELLLGTEGIEINARDHNGRTPLYCASYKGNTGVVELLLEGRGIDVNAKSNYCCYTAPHEASQNGRAEVLRLLLERTEIEINATTFLRWTPLHLATFMGDVPMVKALLEHDRIGTTLRDRDNGQTALHIASACVDLEVIDALLSKEDSVIHVLDDHAFSPADLALFEGHDEVVGRLNSRGCCPK